MKKIVWALLLSQSGYAAESTTSAQFKVEASIEKGCSLSSVSQQLDFGRHPVTAQSKVYANIQNTEQSWNIRCTEKLPVKISLDNGLYAEQNTRRMRHAQQSQFIAYHLYRNSDFKDEYLAGNSYSLVPTSTNNPMLNFSIYAVADLQTNQPKSAGFYQDRVAITISW